MGVEFGHTAWEGYSYFAQPIKDCLSFPTKSKNSQLHGILGKCQCQHANVNSTVEGFSITKSCSQPFLIRTSFQFWEGDDSSKRC